jgi:hypothetical protein
VASAVAIVVALPAAAVANDVALFSTPPADGPPPSGPHTGPSLGAGEDYKSDPAKPETPQSDNHDVSLTEAVKVFNPNDDPNVRVCQQKDRSFTIEISEPADPSKPTGSGIKDGEPC